MGDAVEPKKTIILKSDVGGGGDPKSDVGGGRVSQDFLKTSFLQIPENLGYVDRM